MTPTRKTEVSAAEGRRRAALAARPATPAALAKRARPLARRAPVHPGYFLETRFLAPLHITQQALAKALGISRRRVNELIRGRRGVTADTAVRLALFFSNDPAFWMQLQTDWDLHQAAKRLKL